MHCAFFTHEPFVRSRIFHTPFLAGAGAGRRTYVALCPGVFSSGIRPRRSSGDCSISEVQTWRIPELAGDQDELSVGTPTSSSTFTAVSGSGGEVMGRCSIRAGETRRWRTSLVRKNYNDHSLPPHELSHVGFHTLVCGCRYGTEALPHARASSRRGYDPDGSGSNG
ncbi:hypothetical protein EVAR_35796_1 [Eumeta japonica]|uniref:Uncharacterized protein n=1 Tax=Eumeta variegata TaxID=151549 RepID=A0A4C1WMC6_EUMVA|nr:hypothetical protein EVAR_35796_1 [Eumeta japonica]